MKLLTRLVLSGMILASLALATRADSTSLRSSSLNDFKVILNDPSCPSGTICVELGYDGPASSRTVNFVLPTPLQIPAGQIAACGTNFGSCQVHCEGVSDCDAGDYVDKIQFHGVFTSDEDLDIGISGLSDFSLVLPSDFSCENASQCANGIINFATTPEPSAVLLLAAGLLVLGVLRRKHFGASTAARLS